MRPRHFCRGNHHIFVCKKGYADLTTGEKHIKGLVTDEMTVEQMEKWLDGELPKQMQTQRQGFLKVLAGEKVFKDNSRLGADVNKLKNISMEKFPKEKRIKFYPK